MHRETKVAIFVIIAGTMLYMGFNFLKGIDFFSSTKKYYAVYPDVQGLMVSNAVIVNGLNVGRVSEISFTDDTLHGLRVTLDIRKEVSIGDSSIASIASQGLLGSKSILVKIMHPEKPLPEKSYLISEIEQGMMDKLSLKTEPILKNFNSSLERVNGIMSPENTVSLTHILANFDRTTLLLNHMIASNDARIGAILQNVQNLTTSLVETEKMLKPILAKTNTFADSLNKMQLAATIENTNKALVELNKSLLQINKGKGTVGKLLYDDSLYTYLSNSSRDLDKLLIDLKEKPKRYVHFSLFGRKDK